MKNMYGWKKVMNEAGHETKVPDLDLSSGSLVPCLYCLCNWCHSWSKSSQKKRTFLLGNARGLTSFSLSVRTLISSSYLSSFSEYCWHKTKQINATGSDSKTCRCVSIIGLGAAAPLPLRRKVVIPKRQKVLAWPGNRLSREAIHGKPTKQKHNMYC